MNGVGKLISDLTSADFSSIIIAFINNQVVSPGSEIGLADVKATASPAHYYLLSGGR